MTQRSFAHKYRPCPYEVPIVNRSVLLNITDTIAKMSRATSPSMQGSNETKKDEGECIILRQSKMQLK